VDTGFSRKSRDLGCMAMGRPQGLIPAALTLVAASAALGPAVAQDPDAPPLVVNSGRADPAAKPAPDFLVLSRNDHSDTVSTSDLPLVLAKAGREEKVLVRRAVFVASSVQLTTPIMQAADETVVQTCRWTYQTFLQRQVCFTSMVGLFSCTEPEVVALPDGAAGQSQLSAAEAANLACGDAYPPAAAARAKLIEPLRARASALFDADERTKSDPIFRAAGVTIRPGKLP
jgi:hypothetical protein